MAAHGNRRPQRNAQARTQEHRGGEPASVPDASTCRTGAGGPLDSLPDLALEPLPDLDLPTLPDLGAELPALADWTADGELAALLDRLNADAVAALDGLNSWDEETALLLASLRESEAALGLPGDYPPSTSAASEEALPARTAAGPTRKRPHTTGEVKP